MYRNALHLPLLHGFNINTKDQEFSLLSRAQFINNPPQQRLVPTWDPTTVLSMLDLLQFHNSSASPADLFAKTLFSVALATGNRVSELAALSRCAVSFTQDLSKVVIPVKLGFLFKNQSVLNSAQYCNTCAP